MAVRALLVSTVLLAAGGAQGAGLDAPPEGSPTQPSPAPAASEIRRGADAAFGCQISVHRLDGEALLRCLQDQQQTNQLQMGQGHDAFDAGLWYVGRGRLRALASVAPASVSKLSLAVAAGSLGEAEMACGATEDDVWRALHPPRISQRPVASTVAPGLGGSVR